MVEVQASTQPRFLSQSAWPEAPDDRALVEEFYERGYVVLDLAVPDFAHFAEALITDLAPAYDASGRLQDAWRRYGRVRDLAVNEQVLKALELLYGRDAFPFQTLNFNKGTEQATHSDTIHFDSQPADFMAGVWIALEDIDEGNGPLHYFPGSHRLPRIALSDIGITSIGARDPHDIYVKQYEPFVQRFTEEKGLKAERGLLKQGHALIWSANLLHGGTPILQPGRSRHSQVTHYYFADCSYFTPLRSDITTVYRRHPVDIRTAKIVPGVVHGRQLSVPLKIAAKEWLKARLKTVTITK